MVDAITIARSGDYSQRDMELSPTDRHAEILSGLSAGDHASCTLRIELAGVTVERVAESGDPAFPIADFAQTNGVDLIMMPTHGVGLFRRLLIGSVAAGSVPEFRHAEAALGEVPPRKST